MPFDIRAFSVDSEKQTQGVWVEVGAGLSIKIARLGHPAYQKRLNELLKPIRDEVALGISEANTDQIMEVTQQAVAETILLDWRNLDDGDEKNVPFSPERALTYFRAYPEFYDIVLVKARGRAAFTSKSEEANSGN